MEQLIKGNTLDVLRTMESDSIDLIITSPPYNKNYWLRNRNQKGKRIITYDQYSDNMSPNDYINNQIAVITEMVRIIKPSGSIYYNHIDILHKHNTIHPHYVYQFALKQLIIWDRGNTPKLDKSYFLPTTEYVFWIKKSWESVPYFNRKDGQHRKNIWRINKAKNNDHPAPMPEELVENIIKTSSPPGGIILDPYSGSGTTGIVAKRLGYDYIGIDISQQYLDMAQKRFDDIAISYE